MVFYNSPNCIGFKSFMEMDRIEFEQFHEILLFYTDDGFCVEIFIEVDYHSVHYYSYQEFVNIENL